MQKLSGQVAVVTGASAGIGEATARRLAREGAAVVLEARRGDRLEALRSELEASGGKALVVAGDVTSASHRELLVGKTLEAFGRIDILVNNAGYGQRGPVEIVSVEDVRRNFETNLFSLIALTQLVIPAMRSRQSGLIVNLSSVAGRIARPLSSIYDATKHALEAISDGLRGELAPFGIRVVLVEPGFILTEFLTVANELARPVVDNPGPYAPFVTGFQGAHERARRIAGRPEDIADVICRAAASRRPRARYAAPFHARVLLMLKRFVPERLFDYTLIRLMDITAERLKSHQPAAERVAGSR